MTEENVMKNRMVEWGLRILGIVLILFPIILIPLTGSKIVFYNNDDLFLQELVSGAMTGTPESHLIYIGYLTGWLLSRLYIVLPQVPWYGLWLCGCLYGSVVYIIYKLSLLIEDKLWRMVFMAGSMLVCCAFLFQHLLSLQYTTVTAVLAACAIVIFLCTKPCDNVKEYLLDSIPGFVFWALSFELRNKACFMILAVFIVLVIVRILKDKKNLKAIMAYIGVLMGLIVMLSAVEVVAYSSQEWQAFKCYNTAREELLDFKGYPLYDDYTAVYEELGISASAYDAAKNHYLLLLEENINAEAFETLAETEDKSFDAITFIKEFIIEQYISYGDYPINFFVYFLYVATVVLLILFRRKQFLWEVAGLFVARNAIWAYLVLGGRIVPWVTQGLYIMEFFVLVSILACSKLWDESKPIKGSSLVSKVLLFGLTACVMTGIIRTNTVIDYNKYARIEAENYIDLRAYCTEQEENLYLMDVLSVYAMNYYALADMPESAGNMVLLGGWPVKSPWSDRIGANYGIDSYMDAVRTGENVYFIYLDEPATGYEYLEKYLADKGIAKQVTVVDTLTTDYGKTYLILGVQ